MNKIALVIPYFISNGQSFPNYFNFWLESAKNNSDFCDFIIFTNNHKKYDYPKNVKVFYMEFEQFKDIVQKNFDFKITLDSPYKLCDYKVTYGEVLHNYLNDYEFWGYCDIDLIFGDISKFITEELLSKYDKIFQRGHFTLYRNSSEINCLYRTDMGGEPYYKTVFTSPKSFAFDEYPGIAKIYRFLDIPVYEQMPFVDVWVNQKCFARTTNKIEKLVFVYDHGKLFSVSKKSKIEIMYVHLQKRTMKVETSNFKCFKIQPEEFVDIDVNTKYSIRIPSKWYINHVIEKLFKH